MKPEERIAPAPDRALAATAPARRHPSPATDLSVVVVSWNTRALLAQCLASLGEPTATADAEAWPGVSGLSVDVLVVDNGSTDGTPEMIGERFPWVRLLENRENVGFARANNQALRVSRGRYVLLLNPDTEVRPRALESLVDFMDRHPRAGAAGALVLNPDGTLQTSCYREPTLSRELWRLFHLDRIRPYGRYDMSRWDPQTPREVDVAQGACLILRREALAQVGPLDEDYFIYSEEVDLCYRLRRQGWKVYWVPRASVVHYGGQSTSQVASAMFLRLYQGKVLYFRKHHGTLAARFYKAILLGAALARLALGPLAWLEGPSRRQRHFALADRYWQLVRALPGL